MHKYGYAFQTHLPVNDCIERIISMPWEFRDPRYSTPLWYKCQMISATRLLITFTGGQFQRFRRTEYIVDFYTRGQQTVIEMYFHKEFLSLLPYTSTQDLDAFMSQKIMAKRLGECHRQE